MSKDYGIEEIPEVTFPTNFKLIDQYHQEDPSIIAKLKCEKYQTGNVFKGWNNIKIKT